MDFEGSDPVNEMSAILSAPIMIFQSLLMPYKNVIRQNMSFRCL